MSALDHIVPERKQQSGQAFVCAVCAEREMQRLQGPTERLPGGSSRTSRFPDEISTKFAAKSTILDDGGDEIQLVLERLDFDQTGLFPSFPHRFLPSSGVEDGYLDQAVHGSWRG